MLFSLLDVSTAEQISKVLIHATAPAFLLSAVASFIALLISRMNGIMDRIRTINAIQSTDTTRLHLKADLPRLKLRAKLLHRSIYFATASAILTTVLIAASFVVAIFQGKHEYGAALLFILTLSLFGISLWNFAREIRISLTEFDHIY